MRIPSIKSQTYHGANSSTDRISSDGIRDCLAGLGVDIDEVDLDRTMVLGSDNARRGRAEKGSVYKEVPKEGKVTIFVECTYPRVHVDRSPFWRLWITELKNGDRLERATLELKFGQKHDFE